MLKLLFVALVFVGYESNASVFLEPYGGYTWGTTETQSVASTTTEKFKSTGWGAGLRSGLTLADKMFIAADATYFDIETKSEADGEPSNATQLLLGAAAGFILPGSLRIWGGYYFKNELEYKAEGLSPREIYSGTAWKAGLSFELFSYAHLAFEYFVHEFDKYEGQDGEETLKEAGIIKYDHQTYFVSLTFPLGLPGSNRRR